MDKVTENTIIRHTQKKYFTDQESYLWQLQGGGYSNNLFIGPLKSLRDRICTGSQYVPQFAVYPHKTEVKEGRPINILEVADIMISSALRHKCVAIRQAVERGDAELKNKLKSDLPYITHTGIFIPRRNDGLILPAFTYQLDIDHSKNGSIDPDRVLLKIIKDRQLNVLLACKSPSGKGVKALLFLKELLFIRDTWTHEQYRTAYHKVTDILKQYFLQEHSIEIDTQMKSISQPFYLFYSDDLFINKGLRR